MVCSTNVYPYVSSIHLFPQGDGRGCGAGHAFIFQGATAGVHCSTWELLVYSVAQVAEQRRALVCESIAAVTTDGLRGICVHRVDGHRIGSWQHAPHVYGSQSVHTGVSRSSTAFTTATPQGGVTADPLHNAAHGRLPQGWLAMARHAYQDRGNAYKDALLHDKQLRASLTVARRGGSFSLCTQSRATDDAAAPPDTCAASAAEKTPPGRDTEQQATHQSIVDELAAKYGCVMDSVLDEDDASRCGT